MSEQRIKELASIIESQIKVINDLTNNTKKLADQVEMLTTRVTLLEFDNKYLKARANDIDKKLFG